jgi:outer membrane protein assembly factor BamB
MACSRSNVACRGDIWGYAVVLSDRAAYLNDGNTIRAFRLSTGEEIWKVPAERGYYKPADLFVTGGLVWTKNNKKTK